MPEPWLGEIRPCPRGTMECGGTAEPEEDGSLRYWVCGACSFTFGWEQMPQDAGACFMGVPEHLQDRRAPVFVELGRRTN